jgi:hypothetical protein
MLMVYCGPNIKEIKMTTLKNIVLFFAAPFIGLVYMILLPFVGLAALVYLGGKYCLTK